MLLRPGAEPDAKAVREWSRERLAAYKVPREIVALNDLPCSARSRAARSASTTWKTTSTERLPSSDAGRVVVEDAKDASVLPHAVAAPAGTFFEHARGAQGSQGALGRDLVHPQVVDEETGVDDGVRDEVREHLPGTGLGTERGHEPS